MVIVEMGSSQGCFCRFMSLCFFFLLPSIAQFSTLMVVADLQVSGNLQFVWFHKMMIPCLYLPPIMMISSAAWGFFLTQFGSKNPQFFFQLLGLASSGSKLTNAQISPFPWLKSSPPCMIGLEF